MGIIQLPIVISTTIESKYQSREASACTIGGKISRLNRNLKSIYNHIYQKSKVKIGLATSGFAIKQNSCVVLRTANQISSRPQ